MKLCDLYRIFAVRVVYLSVYTCMCMFTTYIFPLKIQTRSMCGCSGLHRMACGHFTDHAQFRAGLVPLHFRTAMANSQAHSATIGCGTPPPIRIKIKIVTLTHFLTDSLSKSTQQRPTAAPKENVFMTSYAYIPMRIL